jgi:hypothetical protein
MNHLKLIGKIIFLLFTFFYLIIPLFLIIETKINNPSFKNLNTSWTIILGIITFISIILNVIFFKPYFKKKL